MKKVMNLSICLLVIITSIASAYANNNSSHYDEKGKMEITLTLDDVKAGQQLLIKNLQGLIIYKKTIERSGVFNNTFDLKALPTGTYYFEHIKDYQIRIIPFTVDMGKVTFDVRNEKVYFKPVVRIKHNHLLISKLDLDQSPLDLNIYYSENSKTDYELIHAETITDEMKIEKIYKLSHKRKGEYKVEIITNGRTYVEYFNI